MYELISGYWVACGIHASAQLGIADLLAEGPSTVASLAESTQCHPPSLYRLLRAMASVGIFEETEDGRFSLNALGATLLSDVPGSVRPWALANLGEHFIPFGNLAYGIRTGQVPFEKVYGMSVWDYYKANPEQGVNLMKAMTGMSGAVIREVITAYDFSPFTTIVDVGGGNGALLFSILNACPRGQGIVFDEPYVVEQTGLLIPPDLSGRCSVSGGDFFRAVPAGADAYTIKWVLHDWNDEEVVTILTACREAMHKGSKLFIMESVISDEDRNAPHPGKLLDLNIFAMTTGRERTDAEYKWLIERSGLSYVQTIPTSTALISLIEAERKA